MLNKIIEIAVKNIKYYNLKGFDDVKAVIQTAIDMSDIELTENDENYISNEVWKRISG